MGKIGLFYGSDTGCTEAVAEMIQEQLGEDVVDIYDVYDVSAEESLGYVTMGLDFLKEIVYNVERSVIK